MRILIADDHGIVRQGLRGLLEEEADWQVVGEASDGRAAVEMTKQLCPDVVLMDITMPSLNGVDATRQILEHNPDTKVVALSVHTEPSIVTDMIRAGACGYVLKTYLFEDLAKAIRSVAEGHHYLSPAIAGIVVGKYLHGTTGQESGGADSLSSREREIVQLIAEGKTTKQIALLMHISPKTVDGRRRRSMEKLGVSSIAELTKFAISHGLTSVNT